MGSKFLESVEQDVERIARWLFEFERKPHQFWDAAQPRRTGSKTAQILDDRDRNEYRRRARSVLAGADI